MNSSGAALTTVIQQFLYPVTDAPKYKKGFGASLRFIIGMCAWVVVVRWFEIRALREKKTLGEMVSDVSSSERIEGDSGATVRKTVGHVTVDDKNMA
jgi:ACS family pantothenate transporter-like MFS transporter